jgi:hypothetical protein
MQIGRIIDVFLAIVTVAGVSAVVGSPNTANIIEAWGKAFAGSLTAAK